MLDPFVQFLDQWVWVLGRPDIFVRIELSMIFLEVISGGYRLPLAHLSLVNVESLSELISKLLFDPISELYDLFIYLIVFQI